MIDIVPPLLVFVPLLGAIAAYLLPRAAPSLALVVAGLGCVAALVLFVNPGANTGSTPWTMALGGWVAPLGIGWRIDGLSMTLLSLTWTLGLGVGVYAKAYFEREPLFWPLLLMLMSGCSAIFMANDLFNIYVMLEILGLSAVALVTLAQNRTALSAALTYLFVSLAGSLCYLAGVALLYSQHATLDISLLGERVTDTPLTWVALGLMGGGLLLKSAIFPLHFWLPSAHSSAPAPISALLSALVVKASFFVLLRLWRDVAPSQPEPLAWFFGGVGVAAIAYGSIEALRTPRLKLLVAYSTVAQLGYLMLLFPLSLEVEQAAVAYAGVAYFMVAHGIAKAALFMAAGNLQKLAGHDRLAELKHAAATLQPTLFAVALAGASIMGLPPSGGFIAKWTLLSVSLSSGAWFWIVVLLGGGLLSVAYVFRILMLGFQEDAKPIGGARAAAIGPLLQVVPVTLGIVAVALGFNAMPVIDAVSQSYATLAGGRP